MNKDIIRLNLFEYSNAFVIINKSEIINFHNVLTIENDIIHIKTGLILYISRGKNRTIYKI